MANTSLPKDWRKTVESLIRQYFEKDRGSPEGMAWSLNKAGSGRLLGPLSFPEWVNVFSCARWIKERPRLLIEAKRILGSPHTGEAAREFSKAATNAKKGIISEQNRVQSRQDRALKLLAQEISYLAEQALRGPVHIPAKTSQKVAQAIVLIRQYKPEVLIQDLLFVGDMIKFLNASSRQQSKRRRTPIVIVALTEAHNRIYGSPVFAATAALLDAAFPLPKSPQKEDRTRTAESVESLWNRSRAAFGNFNHIK